MEIISLSTLASKAEISTALFEGEEPTNIIYLWQMIPIQEATINGFTFQYETWERKSSIILKSLTM